MNIQQNIINDISTLSKVPYKALSELIEREILCIGSAIHDALVNKEDTTVLNIGIGNLSIDLKDMQCKFIPSKELKATIKRVINDKIDPLEFELEESIIEKITKLCSEIL